MNKSWIYFLLLHLLLSSSVEYLYAYIPLKDLPSPSSPETVINVEHDANEVGFELMSNGQLAHDSEGDPYYSGGFWPRGTLHNYIFGSGLWIAGIADVGNNGDDEYVGLQAYEPMSGGSAFAPGRIGESPHVALSRLFLSTSAQDLLDWPTEFRDNYGEVVVHSPQDIVGIYNDISAIPLFSGGPYGIQVEQRSMAFSVGRLCLADHLRSGTHTLESVQMWTSVPSLSMTGAVFSPTRYRAKPIAFRS
jgi:hypothetical protein